MKIGIPRETFPGERRVAVVPGAVGALLKSMDAVRVESGAGEPAGFPDSFYQRAGAELGSREDVFACDIVAQVRTLGANPREGLSDLPLARAGQALVGLADPLRASSELRALAGRGVMLFALELLPRTSRAQSMDVLTSMATLAGYKAVLLAAGELPKIFPMMVTAAGTLAPARLLVIGAGVAGLQAIATARRLGAVVTAYDVRTEVREEIESLGARFAELPLEAQGAGDERGYARELGEDFYRRQRDHMKELVAGSDAVVTTAAVPGRPAPKLVTAGMIEAMAPGSVLVDLAAATGGNCELTRPDEIVVHRGVSVMGPTNLPATLAFHASQMFARNVAAFVDNLVEDGKIRPPLEDDILRETLVCLDGELVHRRLTGAKREG